MKKTVRFISGDRQLYDNFHLTQVIGKGNSIVYEAVDKEGKAECVKEVKLQDKMNEFIFRKEIQLLTKIKANPHPCIVQYRGSYTLQQSKGQFISSKKGYIQMEKGITNLQAFLLHRNSFFSPEEVMKFMASMIEVFAHLQRSEIAHRDIKPSNILIFSEEPLEFKICDVGAGTAVGYCDNTKEMTVIGTPYYLSPQLYRAHRQKMHLTNYKAFKSDTYSLGLLFLEFCTLRKIEDRGHGEQQKIKSLIKEIKQRYPNVIGMGKILRKMLEEDVGNRMDFIELQKYTNQNTLLRNKIDNSVQLDTALISLSTVTLTQLSELTQLKLLVSTNHKFQRLIISISSAMIPQPQIYLQELINIKYMKLKELELKMEMCGVGDRAVQLLADAMEKNGELVSLKINLWNNQVTNEGLKKLLKSIGTNLIELQHLTLSLPSNQLRIDSKYEQLFTFPFKNLASLSLDFSFNEIQQDYLSKLFKQLSNLPLKLLNLHLESIKSNPIHFSRAIKELLQLQKLEQININASGNSLREEGMYALGDLAVQIPSIRKVKYVLRGAQISDKGFSQFMKTLAKNTSLQELKLNLLNNQITEKGIRAGMPYFDNFSALSNLDLNFSNSKLTQPAFKSLCTSILLAPRLSQLRLIFDGCGVTSKACLYIGRLISQEASLQEIEVGTRGCQEIGFDGVQYICAGLMQARKIKKLKLDLQGCMIGDYSANYLASCLLKMRHLTTVDLNLELCDLSSQTMTNIFKAVRECCHNTEQITIDMRKNKKVKTELYEEIKKGMEGSRVAIKVDQPDS